MKKQITKKLTILTLMLTFFMSMGLNAQQKYTYVLPGDYDNTAAALIGIKNNSDIVNGDTVIINILNSYTSTADNEGLLLGMNKSLIITLQGAGAGTTILGPKTPNRWLNFNNANSVEGVEFIIKDLTVKGFGLANYADGNCINTAANGMNFNFINVNFEDMNGGVGTVFRALGEDQFVSFDNCYFTNNHTKKAAGNPRGLIYKGNGGMLSIKNSTFITNYADVLDGTVDPIQKFGGVLDLVGSLTDSLDIILENNVFANNLVEAGASSDTIQAMMVLDPRRSYVTLQMTNNIFIENRRDGINDDIDILLWDTDSIAFTLTDNIANKIYSAKLSDDEVPVEIIEPIALDGFTTNEDFTYTHQDINFTMDGDLPEIMVDEFGVNYVTYSGSAILVAAIDLSAELDSIFVDGNLQIVADVTPEDASNMAVTWDVDHADIATIDANGMLTGVAAGTVTVSATSVDGSNVKGEIMIKVYVTTSVVVSAIDLSALADSVAVGSNLQIDAEIAPTDAENKAVTWGVDRTDLATIDANGLLTGVAPGTVTVSATSVDGSNVKGEMVIKVYGTTSVKDGISRDLHVYPNPSNGEFVVALPANINILGYDVYNVFGSKVQSGILSDDNNYLNLLDHPKGMYILKTHGEETIIVRLVVR